MKESIERSIEFPVFENNEKQIGKISYPPNGKALENRDVVKGVVYLIESAGSDYNDISLWAFKECLNRNNVTCQELIDAYWKAYSDPYVGKEGIQWRHLWKHIEKSRVGSGSKLYTYNEMLNIVDKEYIDTDHFESVKTDEGVRWRRK